MKSRPSSKTHAKGDPHQQVARELILAIEQASESRHHGSQDLASKGYSRLQFDFPLVDAAEVNALADLFQQCLELKPGGGLGPLSKYLVTAKFVENIVDGAKRPSPPPAAADLAPQHSTAAGGPAGGASVTTAEGSGTAGDGASTAGTASQVVSLPAQGGPAAAAAALQLAYQRLCTHVLLRYSAAALRLPEGDAWQLLAAYESDGAGVDDDAFCDGGSQIEKERGDVGGGQERGSQQQQQHQGLNMGDLMNGAAGDVDAPESDPDDFEFEPLEDHSPSFHTPHSPPTQNRHHSLPYLHNSFAASCPVPHLIPPPVPPASAAASQPAASRTQHPSQHHGLWPELLQKLCTLVCPDHLDALLPSSGTGDAVASSTSNNNNHMSNTTAPPNLPHDIMNLKSVLGNQNASKATASSTRSTADTGGPTVEGSSVASVPDLDAWGLSDTGSALMQLLRSVGVHKQAVDLHPLLQACVSLLSRRLCAHPEEIPTSLPELWDTLGVCGVASMPPALKGYSSGSAPGHQHKQLVLAPEASPALTLIVDLASCHISSQGRTALWRQVNLHTLPVLKRCLEDVAAAKEVNSDTFAAVTLVSKVVLFYLEDAPGGFNAAKALLSGGVVRGLAVAVPSLGPLPDAIDLRTAALLCAAGSSEVCSWIAAVPGVAATLSAPAFQLGGWGEAHGALWQLLSAPVQLTKTGQQQQQQQQQVLLLFAILDNGAACSSLQKLQRMHAVLELLLKAWHQSGHKRFWGPTVDAALRKALSTLKQALVAVSSTPAAQLQPSALDAQPQQNGDSAGSSCRVCSLQPGLLDAADKGEAGAQAEGVKQQRQGLSVVRERSEEAGVQGDVKEFVGEDNGCSGLGCVTRVSQSSVKGVCEFDEDEGKARGLDVGVLEVKSLQRVGGACVKQLKELLMSDNKMD